MEHSLLHALQLCGIVVALGGAILMLGILFPALRSLNLEVQPPALAGQLSASVSRWFLWGASVGVLAASLNLFVDVAEVQGQTIFGGVSPAVVWRFATITTVGRLSLLRLFALLLTAGTFWVSGRWKWRLGFVSALAAAVCESLISHAAAQPAGRTSAITVELIHILAASLWLGVLIHLLLARPAIESAENLTDSSLVAELIRRFSPVAMTAVGLLGLSGLFLVIRYLCMPSAIPTTAYGLTLLVKLVLVVPLLYAGAVNYRVIRPRLQALTTADAKEAHLASIQRRVLLRRFSKLLELEVTAGILVIVMAGILASVSPPVGTGNLRLTNEQITALVTPHLPRVAIANPATFYGAQERTVADLQYAEFTHNWSGVMVCMLGCGWLAVSLGGRLGRRAEKVWPWLLVPFPFFIAIAADPEVWLLHKVSLRQTISDPQLLEHQIGALLAFTLVCLGWLDRRLPARQRPLGYALPVLMILGSLLLLGHAHSNFTSTQELTNLINVQHAVFGSFGLFAGTLRLLNLRGLFPSAIARPLWPTLIIGLGLYMAFCYREVV
jgi:putative copper export protein